MAFVFEIEYTAPHTYIKEFARALAETKGVDLQAVQSGGRVTLIASEADPRLASYLEELGAQLPASLFMGGSSHRLVEGVLPVVKEDGHPRLPHAVAPCPRCMKEMFDPASRRYYYPFTGCNCCGAHYPFFERYPMKREHTSLRFFTPCDACAKELDTNPFRRDFPLISCHECGIPVRMREESSVRYANDPGSFKGMFERAAAAIAEGRTVRVKSLFGDRLFYDAARVRRRGRRVMLALDASKMEHLCALIEEEVHALLSIERPMIRAAVADPDLFGLYGRVTPLKYPDEGFSILLAKELLNLGYAHIAYEELSFEEGDADLHIDFDPDIEPQRETLLFINKSVKFFVEGERGLFPLRFGRRSDRIVAAGEMAAVPDAEGLTIDRMEKFDRAEASALYLPEGEEVPLRHSRTVRFSREAASMMSVLLEHSVERERAVGVCFTEEPLFLYHDARKPIVVTPPVAFDASGLREAIATLREGSDRLVENFEATFPHVAERLFGAPGIGSLFEAAALVAELEEPSLEALGREAMNFSAKGGVQIDMKSGKNRFDPYAFLASLMSYRLAGADSVLLSYSIFESFGDYIGEVLTDLRRRTKSEHIVLCGRAFGNPSLFSRIRKNLGRETLLMNRVVPIDGENQLLGATGL
ncbi:hypothetical protein [Hydrogenimonas sp.]